MKKATTLFAAILLLAVGATAQKLSYQAVVRNNANELVTETTVQVAVTVLNANNAVQYAETHANVQTNRNGLLSLMIGDGVPTGSTTLAGVEWPGASLRTVITLPDNTTITNVTPVNSVPYALYAENVSPEALLAAVNAMTAEQKAALNNVLFFECGTSTVTDHEGNVYATVQIGNQCWMRDNLRTTTSPSTGTYLIPAAGTGNTYTGKQARWYNNDSATYALMNYGLLYNWNAAVDTFNTAYGETSVNNSSDNAVSVTFSGHRRGICPAGWHLPSDAEWTQLENYVGSQSEYTCSGNSNYIAKALASTEGWNSYSGECYPGDQSVTANNATGFSAVPAGYCSGSSFYNAGSGAYFWSATQYASYPDYAYDRRLYYDSAYVLRSTKYKFSGYSVRCLRD